MPHAKILSCPVDQEIVDALNALRERHGTPVSEAIRRALRAYLEAEGVLKAAKRPAPRRGLKQPA